MECEVVLTREGFTNAKFSPGDFGCAGRHLELLLDGIRTNKKAGGSFGRSELIRSPRLVRNLESESSHEPPCRPAVLEL